MRRLEFTIEPFVEGRPGPHVTEVILAVQGLGVDVEVGPFGSGCLVAQDQAGAVASMIVATALAHGASHVNIDIGDEEPM